MNKGQPETLEEALDVIKALNERTAANDVTIRELNGRLAELAEIPRLIGELDQTKAELADATMRLTAAEQTLERAAQEEQKLRAGIAMMVSRQAGGVDLVLAALLDKDASAKDVARSVERGLLECSIQQAQSRLAELSKS